MQNPTREEMIRMAHETRRQVTNAEVPDELMRQFRIRLSIAGRIIYNIKLDSFKRTQ